MRDYEKAARDLSLSIFLANLRALDIWHSGGQIEDGFNVGWDARGKYERERAKPLFVQVDACVCTDDELCENLYGEKQTERCKKFVPLAELAAFERELGTKSSHSSPEKRDIATNRKLCDTCGGNGTVSIKHGVSVCPGCKGFGWATSVFPRPFDHGNSITERYGIDSEPAAPNTCFHFDGEPGDPPTSYHCERFPHPGACREFST